MALMQPPICDFGWPAPAFDLRGVDGRRCDVIARQATIGGLAITASPDGGIVDGESHTREGVPVGALHVRSA